MPAIFRHIEGRGGTIDVPYLGALVGNIANWSLTRRADRGPDAEFFDLHAVLTFVSKAMFDDSGYDKRVIIQAGKGRRYRLEPQDGPGQRTALNGRSLIMERVKLWPEQS